MGPLTNGPEPIGPIRVTTTADTSAVSTFDALQTYLAAQDFRQADEETRSLLIKLAGEAAETRGYVFFSEVQFIAVEDLKAIDELWKQYSNGKFGYSVQRKVWKKVNKDFSRFFVKVGWMKKLDTEVLQYNYKAFPNEFFWENDENVPEGHLPLTNALRGTQLLTCVLSHPAFDNGEEVEEEDGVESRSGGILGGKGSQEAFFQLEIGRIIKKHLYNDGGGDASQILCTTHKGKVFVCADVSHHRKVPIVFA
ncbi:hypothetical protein ACFE04_005385 [Oxalis oulophora]